MIPEAMDAGRRSKSLAHASGTVRSSWLFVSDAEKFLEHRQSEIQSLRKSFLQNNALRTHLQIQDLTW